ncbi:MAG: four-helix bundle copper-binding protein [Candidatus Cyclobacteriaceae bacterium M2_1C_046]
MDHHSENNKELLRLLAECADECNHCYNACMENERTEKLLRSLRLCRDCSRMCRTASDFVSSGSELADQVVKLCAEACRLCAESCAQDKEHEQECKACADICRECEEACNSFEGVSA